MKLVDSTEICQCLPYEATDFAHGFRRLLGNPDLLGFLRSLFPGFKLDGVESLSQGMVSAQRFQEKVISKLMKELEIHTTRGVTQSGLAELSASRKYLLLSNHRDIICDPAWVAYLFFLNGLPTPKICLGDNLLVNSLVTDLVKMNKGLIVKRDLPPRELLKWSHVLSQIIREQINQDLDSVWIAQREGRAKDGDDRTQSGLLKMLTLSGQGDFLNKLESLSIVPLAISYEYDPCDALKARELYFTARDGHYTKRLGEDSLSMLEGVKGFKGRVHLAFGQELSAGLREALSHRAESNKKDLVLAVTGLVDSQIHRNYKNWPSNYVAYDLLMGGSEMLKQYSSEEKQFFEVRMEKQLHGLSRQSSLTAHDRAEMKTFFLKSYAQPVINQRALPP
jgi:hypothetical protein